VQKVATQTSTYIARFFVLDQKILKRAKYLLIDSLSFAPVLGHYRNYPDNFMPPPIYRKSMGGTPALLSECRSKSQTCVRRLL